MSRALSTSISRTHVSHCTVLRAVVYKHRTLPYSTLRQTKPAESIEAKLAKLIASFNTDCALLLFEVGRGTTSFHVYTKLPVTVTFYMYYLFLGLTHHRRHALDTHIILLLYTKKTQFIEEVRFGVFVVMCWRAILRKCRFQGLLIRDSQLKLDSRTQAIDQNAKFIKIYISTRRTK